MKVNSELIDYVAQQRWCGFKKDIADDRVIDVKLDSIPFDNGQKLFTLGVATLDDGSPKTFFMPMAVGHSDKYHTVKIDGVEMYDAMKTTDYWSSLMVFFGENNGIVRFNNGNIVKYRTIAEKELVQENIRAKSKPLNVEQSNTTIRVGDDAIAFKQDRMIESDAGISTEVEVNHKLMEAQCDAMPKSGKSKSNIVRVHGDFHLGQVLVTKDNDVKFLDFAGEPGLPIKERKKKHPEARDIAGMYRSISGYLGPVVAETFAATGETVKRANGSDKNVTDPEREAWANRAIAPMIAAATDAFMRGKTARQPMMALEILRKNLYEVGYEVGNRPDMAHIPVKGLVNLLNSAQENNRSRQQIISGNVDFFDIKANNENSNYIGKTGTDR